MNELLWFATRATGLTSVVLLTVTFVLGMLTSGRAAPVGVPAFVRTSLHRTLSMVTGCFVAVHVVTAIAESYVDIGWLSLLVPFTSAYSPFWVGLGTFAFDLLLAIMITSLLRHRLPQRSWKAVHWVSYALWPIALVHGLGTTTEDGTAMIIISAACGAVGLAALAWRLVSVNADSGRRRLATAQAWR